MADELITFIIEGGAERNGNVTADTFLTKLRQFVATIYAFERAFTRRDQRNVDLEVVELSKINPTSVKFRPRSREQGYSASPAMKWTFEQIERVQRGESVDESIPQRAIDNVVELAKHRLKGEADFKMLRIEYGAKAIAVDPTLEARALALRATRRAEAGPIWHRGVSRGSMFGELRGIMDLEGERRFYILPPSGPDQIECIFPEDMRDQMTAQLFKVVRITGYLRYDGTMPFPYLMEAEKIDGVEPPRKHFADLAGFFRDLEMPEREDVL